MGNINWFENIPFFSIFLSMFCGIITALIPNPRIAQRIHTAMVVTIVLLSGLLLHYTLQTGESFTYMMGHYPAPWGNELKAGPFEAMMALAFSLVMLITITGGLEFIKKDIVREKRYLYYIMLDAALGAMMALIYTNDIFTAYVFIEINTLTACALVMAKGTPRAMVGTTHYLVVSLLGSGLFLLGLSILYNITGHLLMPQIRESVIQIVASGQYYVPLLAASSFMFIAIAMKGALFPFHTWLPTAHPVAVAPSSSILSGFVLKGYVILCLKLIYYVFSAPVMQTFRIIDIIFIFGLSGMVLGSFYAMKQKSMKRMLAYSSIAQLGYIFMGIGLGTRAGVAAACFHVLAHAFTKAMLFLCCGSFVEQTENHSDSMDKLRGAAYRNPLVGIGYTVGALSMIGVPLLAGFISKLYFATASVSSTGRMATVLVVLGISMVLNGLYFLPSLIVLWTPVKNDKRETVKISPTLAISIVAFVVGNVVLGVCYRQILDVIQLGLDIMLM